MNVARAAFGFALGFVAGVAGVLAFQNLRRKLDEESADGLLEDLGEKMKALESRITDVGARAKKRVRKAAAS